MRIGLVCPYSFDVPGGVQNHVRSLAGTLRARGHHVGVLAPGEGSSGDGRALPAYVTTTGRAVAMPYNGSVARVAFGPFAAARVRRWLAAGRYDVLHIHEPATPSLSVLALWTTRTPVVATFHTAQERRSRTLETSAATLLRTGLAKIERHIAVSETARETMARYLAVTPVVIPNGVRYADFSGAREGWPRRPSQPVLLFLGRTDEPRKGLRVLLAALPGLLARRPGLRVVIAGAGGDRGLLRSVPAELHRRVKVHGTVDENAKRRLLAEADLLVAPNTHGESFGIVLVEAMAAGVAVVASDLPAFRQVLGSGSLGRLVPPDEPDAIEERVDGLLADPSGTAALTARARRAAAAYDWSVLTPRILEVYESVLAGRPEAATG